jgi:hypothetical protein
MDTFLALMVDIQFLTRLVDDLPAYIAPDWNAKAVHFVQKIPMCLASIKKHCEMALYDTSDDFLREDMRKIFIHDIRTPLAALKAYAELLTMYLLPHDPVLLLLNEIDYYVDNMRNTISSHYELPTQ